MYCTACHRLTSKRNRPATHRRRSNGGCLVLPQCERALTLRLFDMHCGVAACTERARMPFGSKGMTGEGGGSPPQGSLPPGIQTAQTISN